MVTTRSRQATSLSDYLAAGHTQSCYAWNFEGEPTQKDLVDYGLVTRLMTSKTGQFVVSVAGPSFAGTQTAGEFVSSSELLEQGLKSAPSDWRTKKCQLIVKTNVIDGIPGPPHVVASYLW